MTRSKTGRDGADFEGQFSDNMETFPDINVDSAIRNTQGSELVTTASLGYTSPAPIAPFNSESSLSNLTTLAVEDWAGVNRQILNTAPVYSVHSSSQSLSPQATSILPILHNPDLPRLSHLLLIYNSVRLCQPSSLTQVVEAIRNGPTLEATVIFLQQNGLEQDLSTYGDDIRFVAR